MDDLEYAAKYGRPYEKGEKLPRMAKQLIDARHVSGKGGAYGAAVAAKRPLTAGGELGLFTYHPASACVETRGALAGLVGTGAADIFGGIDLGVRAQPPSRLAPFAGICVFNGLNREELAAETDSRDNDNDMFIDEAGEKSHRAEYLGAVYPELGLHYWLNSRWRVSGLSRYYITTDGRNTDFWTVGLSLSILPGG
jgi:hypothetical protein